MTKTINRLPQAVKELSYSDLGIKYFNLDSWEGLSEDKNYVGVDQSTFADCDNVMIDSDSVLRSRPAVKILINENLVNIDRVWTFDIITAFKCGDKLVFEKSGAYLDVDVDIEDYALVLADEKIFLFAQNRLAYLDLTSWNVTEEGVTADWYDSADPKTAEKALDTVYVPSTALSVDNIPQESESRNMFTSQENRTYIYSAFEGIPDGLFNDRDVIVQIGDDIFKIKYNDLTKYLLVTKTYEMQQISNNKNIVCQERNGILMCVYLLGDDFYYSVDLRSFKYLDTHKTQFMITPTTSQASFILSEDNKFIVIASENQILARSILVTEAGGIAKWQTWTNYFDNKTVDTVYSQPAVNICTDDTGCVWTLDDQCYVLDQSGKQYAGLTCHYKSNSNSVNTTHASSSITRIGTIDSVGRELSDVGFSPDSRFYEYLETNRDVALSLLDLNLLTFSTGNFKYRITSVEGYLKVVDNYLRITNCRINVELLYNSISLSTEQLTCEEFNGSNHKLTLTLTGSMRSEKLQWQKAPNISLTLSFDRDGKTTTGSFNATSGSSDYAVSMPSVVYKTLAWPAMNAINNVPTCQVTANNNTARYYPSSSSAFSSVSSVFTTSNRTIRYQWVNSNYSVWFVQTTSGIEERRLNATHNIVVQKTHNINNADEFMVYTNGEDTYFLTNTQLIRGSTRDLLKEMRPLYIGESTMAGFIYNSETDLDEIYTNFGISRIQISLVLEGQLTIPKITNQAQLDKYYFSSKNKLYVNGTGANLRPGEFKWYFPESNVQPFDYEITGLHPISTDTIAIFFEHGIWYTTWTDNQPFYFKSRIPLGCKQNSDIITTYDGRYTIFSTERGLVSMAYQDFISSTEQALTFLSDDIFDRYMSWSNNEAVKLLAYKFWLLVYKSDSKEAFVFDLRNNSWWPVSVSFAAVPNNNQFFIWYSQLILVYNQYLYVFDTKATDYYDIENYSSDIGKNVVKQINWYIMSQKIHFAQYYYRGERLLNHDTLQYFKKVQGMRFDALAESNDENIFNIDCITYNNTLKLQASKTIKYEIDFVGSIVKKMNYPKLQEFQFILSSINTDIRKPLLLTNIAIKYSITGQVK